MFNLLAAAGIGSIIGGIITNYFQLMFQRNKEIAIKEHSCKFQRYEAITIQMLTVLSFDKHGLRFVKKFRPDLVAKEDYLEEIKTEFLHGIILMSDSVINSLAEFLSKCDYKSYSKVVIAMRKDLWGKKMKVCENTINSIIDIK